MRPCLLLILLLVSINLRSHAGRSSISGHVTDASGKALDSVIVKLVADGGWTFKVAADPNGYFSITGLDARKYVAAFSRSGYETRRVLEIGIDSGKAAHLALDAVLRPAPLQESRLTTVLYQKRTARPIDPGHWMAKAPSSPRVKPAPVSGVDQAAIAAGKPAVGIEDMEVRSTRTYTAPLIDPATPGGRSVKTAERIEPAATRNSADIASLSAKTYGGSNGKDVTISGARASGTTVIPEGMAAEAVVAHSPEIIAAPEARAGSLTSGEINDFSKWNLWEDISYKQLQDYQKTWPVRPENRISVLVKAANGAPLVNASVALLEFGKTIWEARTDNTGKAELWYQLFTTQYVFQETLSLRVKVGTAEQLIRHPKRFDSAINVVQTSFPCSNPKKLDVAFIVDATGSMGDEISYLKAELRDILQRVTDSLPQMQVQTGAVFYRDRGDDYLVRSAALTDSFELTENFIAENDASGGGDGPEAVESALAAGLELGWRDEATARLAFLVLDAPPHSDSATFRKMQQLIRAYASRGIRLIPVACSGSDKPTEYLLRAIALATNGTYLFLTDHSGIGESHTAPTTDKFDVEYLNGLICRVIRSFSTMPECTPELMAAADSTGSADGPHSAWRIYPNPTPDVLHVDHDEKTGFLYVTDISGKLIQRIAVSNDGHSSIDMRQYPAGVYSVRHSWGADQFIDGTFVVRH